MAGVVEIRTYKLLPGTGAEFHRVVVEEVMPLLDRWGTRVLAFGPSLDDADLYYLLRGYESIEDLQKRQEEFYGSDLWRNQLGPRANPLLQDTSNVIAVQPTPGSAIQ